MTRPRLSVSTATLLAWRDAAERWKTELDSGRLILVIDEVIALRARIAQLEPFGPNTHAGVWISRETGDKISKDGA